MPRRARLDAATRHVAAVLESDLGTGRRGASQYCEGKQFEALLSVDNPESIAAYARRRSMNQSTAAGRLRVAWEAVALKLRSYR